MYSQPSLIRHPLQPALWPMYRNKRGLTVFCYVLHHGSYSINSLCRIIRTKPRFHPLETWDLYLNLYIIIDYYYGHGWMRPRNLEHKFCYRYWKYEWCIEPQCFYTVWEKRCGRLIEGRVWIDHKSFWRLIQNQVHTSHAKSDNFEQIIHKEVKVPCYIYAMLKL